MAKVIAHRRAGVTSVNQRLVNSVIAAVEEAGLSGAGASHPERGEEMVLGRESVFD
jgi:hypothetical protein